MRGGAAGRPRDERVVFVDRRARLRLSILLLLRGLGFGLRVGVFHVLVITTVVVCAAAGREVGRGWWRRQRGFVTRVVGFLVPVPFPIPFLIMILFWSWDPAPVGRRWQEPDLWLREPVVLVSVYPGVRGAGVCVGVGVVVVVR